MDGVFEFEEYLIDKEKPKYLSDEGSSAITQAHKPEILEDSEPEVKPTRRCGHGTDLEPEEPQGARLFVKKPGRAREVQILSQSVPVTVPPRFATASQKSGLVFAYEDDDANVPVCKAQCGVMQLCETLSVLELTTPIPNRDLVSADLPSCCSKPILSDFLPPCLP